MDYGELLYLSFDNTGMLFLKHDLNLRYCFHGVY